MKILSCLLLCLSLAGCVVRNGNMWPINEQIDPVTEEPPNVITNR